MMNLTPDAKFKTGIGAALCVVAAAAGFGWKAQATLNSINDSLKSTVTRLDSVEAKLNDRISSFEAVMSDRWTKTAAAEWAYRLLNANPSLRLPDPRDPGRFLNAGLNDPRPEQHNTTVSGRLEVRR